MIVDIYNRRLRALVMDRDAWRCSVQRPGCDGRVRLDLLMAWRTKGGGVPGPADLYATCRDCLLGHDPYRTEDIFAGRLMPESADTEPADVPMLYPDGRRWLLTNYGQRRPAQEAA